MPDLDLNPEADNQKVLAQVVDYYHRTLKETTEGLDYLRSRGITVGEAIDRFRVGYANRTLGLKLINRKLKVGRQLRIHLQQLGLYRGTGREHYNGCVTFPITATDGSGKIVDIYGRKIGVSLRKGTTLHMHLSDECRGVWNVEACAATDEIILCASLFDALTFWNAGYRNVTCTFGPDALTEDHLAAFRQFGIRRVLASAEAVVPRLIAAGIECYLLAMPISLGVNQYALQTTDPAQALGGAIRKAVWQGKGASPTVPVVNAPPAVPDATDDADDDDVHEPVDGGLNDNDLDDPAIPGHA